MIEGGTYQRTPGQFQEISHRSQKGRARKTECGVCEEPACIASCGNSSPEPEEIALKIYERTSRTGTDQQFPSHATVHSEPKAPNQQLRPEMILISEPETRNRRTRRTPDIGSGQVSLPGRRATVPSAVIEETPGLGTQRFFRKS